MTAIQMQTSKDSDRKGTERTSATNAWNPRSLQISVSLKLLSDPICKDRDIINSHLRDRCKTIHQWQDHIPVYQICLLTATDICVSNDNVEIMKCV